MVNFDRGRIEEGEMENAITASRGNSRDSESNIEDPEQNGSNGFRTFFLIKTAYFLLFSGRGSLLPLISVYLTYLGLDVMQIAKIRGFDPLIGIFVVPIIGSLADRFSRHKLALVSCIIGTSLIYWIGLFVPLLNIPNTTDLVLVMNIPVAAGKVLASSNPSTNAAVAEQVFGRCCCLQELCEHGDYCVLYGAANKAKRIVYYHRNATSKNADPMVFHVSIPVDQRNISLCNWSGSNHHNCSVRSELRNRLCNRSCQEGSSGSQLTCCFVVCQDDRRGSSIPLSANTSKVSNRENSIFVFVTMMVIVLLGEACMQPTVPLLDSATMALINDFQEKGQTCQYGRQRLWGALAYVIMPPTLGFAIDMLKDSHSEFFNIYLPAFVLYLITNFLSAAVICLIPYANLPKHQKPLLKNFTGLLKNPEIFVFLIVIFIHGVFVGLCNNYLFIFLHELKQADGFFTLSMLTLTLTCIAEIPFMFLAARVIGILGQRGVIGFGLIAFCVIFLGYSFLHNPWHVLPIELLQGVTSGLVSPAYIAYVDKMAPPEIAATMQSVAFGTRRGLGRGLGTFLGGVVYHCYGARIMFRGAAVLSCLTLIFYWSACVFIDQCRSKKRYQKL